MEQITKVIVNWIWVWSLGCFRSLQNSLWFCLWVCYNSIACLCSFFLNQGWSPLGPYLDLNRTSYLLVKKRGPLWLVLDLQYDWNGRTWELGSLVLIVFLISDVKEWWEQGGLVSMVLHCRWVKTWVSVFVGFRCFLSWYWKWVGDSLFTDFGESGCGHMIVHIHFLIFFFL